MKTEYFDSAEVSDVGRKRKSNEDACLCIPERGIYCVADGMGGQAGGDLASEAITTTLQQVFSKATSEEDNQFVRRIKLVRQAINQASRWIKNFSDEKVIGQMGSTVVALIVDPRHPARAVGLHAGDSRLYQYRKGVLKQVTKDHSAVEALAAKLGISPSEVPAKYQNELLRAVGLTEFVELEKTPVEVESGDVFLICSDGLTKMMSDDAVAKMLKEGAQTPTLELVQKFINTANEAGGKDNVTVVLVRVGDISKAPKIIDTDEDDEDQTVLLTDSESEATVALPPIEAATPSHFPAQTPMPDTDDVHGDTPHTPPSVDLAATLQKPAPSVPAPRTPAAPATPAKPIVFVPAAKPATPPVTAAKKEADPKPATGAKSNTPLILSIVATLAVLAGVGVWLAKGSKTQSADVVPVPVATNKPATTKPSVAVAVVSASNATPVVPVVSNTVVVAANQQAYGEAMKNAQAALTKGDYKGAASYAAAALEKIPGDKPATELLNQVQAQKKTVDAWREALKNAQTALDKRDFNNSVVWADEALEKIPNEPTALKLKAQAQQQLAVATAAAEAEQKYAKAIQDGQVALKGNDPSTAAKSAQAALALRPNDAEAGRIIKQSQQIMDLESGNRFLGQGEYDTVADICRQHPGVAEFTRLMESCRAEQSALTNAQAAFSSGDYATASRVQSQSYARKGPFVALLKEVAGEQQLVSDLESLKKTTNWTAVQGKLAEPALATVTNKVPFRALAQWAQSAADQVTRQKNIQQMNATYETMLVWFNIKKPTDAYIQTPEARKQSRMDSALQDKQRQQYLDYITMLETNYAKYGMLNQNDRAKNLKQLRDVVVHRE